MPCSQVFEGIYGAVRFMNRPCKLTLTLEHLRPKKPAGCRRKGLTGILGYGMGLLHGFSGKLQFSLFKMQFPFLQQYVVGQCGGTYLCGKLVGFFENGQGFL